MKNLFQTKKRHWYEVRFIYKNDNRYPLFNFTQQVGLKKQSDILNDRLIKKLLVPIHKMDNVKHLLCNGILTTEIVCYLGYFKK